MNQKNDKDRKAELFCLVVLLVFACGLIAYVSYYYNEQHNNIEVVKNIETVVLSAFYFLLGRYTK